MDSYHVRSQTSSVVFPKPCTNPVPAPLPESIRMLLMDQVPVTASRDMMAPLKPNWVGCTMRFSGAPEPCENLYALMPQPSMS